MFNPNQGSLAMRPPTVYPYQPDSPAPNIAGPTQDKSPAAGNSSHSVNAPDDFQGAQVREFLRSLDINMDTTPPFEDVTACAGYRSAGVVKINNIPFTVTTQEITQFISRFTNIPLLKEHVDGYPVHIIMEKPTGKTMDCFVEFPNHEAARDCVKRFTYAAQPGRGSKIGNRNVTLDLSDQAELMRAVFQRARFAEFDKLTGKPRILDHSTDPSWTAGFRGFFTGEEIYGLTRFAETPSRSPFVLKCNQRVYESMISTLYKFPWASTQTYTVAAREALFEAVGKQLQILSQKVDTTDYGNPSSYQNGSASIQREVGLSQKLLRDLLFAAINAPGFNQLQKFTLCRMAGPIGNGVKFTEFAPNWPFQTLAVARNSSDNAVRFWIRVFQSGFDIMHREGLKTTYENYITFKLTNGAYPAAEFTPKGIELPFEDGIRIEMGAVMVYLSCGRKAFAADAKLTITDWPQEEYMKLMEKISREKAAGRHFEAGEPKHYGRLEADVSSPPTEFDNQSLVLHDGVRDAATPGTSANSLVNSANIALTPTTISKLNPATAKEFVPASVQAKPPFEPVTNNVYSAFKNPWGNPPTGPALPNVERLSINTDVNNAIATRRSSTGQHGRSDLRLTPPSRDTFGPPSLEVRGFNRPQPSRILPEAFSNPFENQGRQPNVPDVNRAQLSNLMGHHFHSSGAESCNNSTGTALVSSATTTEPQASITDGSSHRHSSFTTTGGVSPTAMQPQRYPDINYSDMEPDPIKPSHQFGAIRETIPSRTQSNASVFAGPNQVHGQNRGPVYGPIYGPIHVPIQRQGQGYSQGYGQGQGQIRNQSQIQYTNLPLPSPINHEDFRTQSTPFIDHQHPPRYSQVRPPPGLERTRGSLPEEIGAVANSPKYDYVDTPVFSGRRGTVAGHQDVDGGRLTPGAARAERAIAAQQASQAIAQVVGQGTAHGTVQAVAQTIGQGAAQGAATKDTDHGHVEGATVVESTGSPIAKEKGKGKTAEEATGLRPPNRGPLALTAKELWENFRANR